MQRAIYCPGVGRWVPLAVYLRAVRLAKAHPDAVFSTGITSWWPTTGREILDQFRQGVNARINQRVPYHERGVTTPRSLVAERLDMGIGRRGARW